MKFYFFHLMPYAHLDLSYTEKYALPRIRILAFFVRRDSADAITIGDGIMP